MAKYRMLDPRCWDDERFVEWDDGKRNLWLLLLLGPAVEIVPGLQSGGIGSLAETLRRPFLDVHKRFGELLGEGRVEIDERFRLIRVNRAPMYNQPSNPNQVMGWFNSWESLPESHLKYLHIESLRQACELADSRYTPKAPTKPKRGQKSRPEPSSKTPFMDAFSRTFGRVKVEERLLELASSRTDWVDPNQPLLEGFREGFPKQLPGPSTKDLPEPLGDHACACTGARAHNDLDLDLEQEQEQEQELNGGRDSGSADAPPAPPKQSGGDESKSKKKSKTPPKMVLDGEPPPKKKPGKTPGKRQPLPDDWAPKPEHEQLARQENRDIEREEVRFRNYCKAERKLYADHDSAFSNWLTSDLGRSRSEGPRTVQREPGREFPSNPKCVEALNNHKGDDF